MNRITDTQLNNLATLINTTLKLPTDAYSRGRVVLRAQVGCLHVTSQYSGVALEQIASDNGGTRDIIARCTKRELFDRMHALLAGIKLARQSQQQENEQKSYEKPQYRDKNPKIDLFSASGYVASTNWHRTCKNAVAYYQAEKPEMAIVRARIDHAPR